MTTQTTLEQAREMADRNNPLPEDFYMDKNGEVQWKDGRELRPQTTNNAGGSHVHWSSAEGLNTTAKAERLSPAPKATDDIKTIRSYLLGGEENDTDNARASLNRLGSYIEKLEYHNSVLKKALGTLLEIEGGGFSSDYLYEQSMLHGGRND